MNQILISEKLYVTPEIRRKKRLYKIEFFISIFLVVVLFSYYIYAEYDKSRNEAKSHEILASLDIGSDVAEGTTIKFSESSTIVVLNSDDPEDLVYSETVEETPIVSEQTENDPDLVSGSTSYVETNASSGLQEVISRNTTTTSSGQTYYTIGIISIPKLRLEYPILNTATTELLKIAPCYFWGASPNEIGNLCIAGHNYRNTKFFSKVPSLTNGDAINITDLYGRTITYIVYDNYVVSPNDRTCTSQLTNGKKEITLITCTNDSSNRVIIKAREQGT